LKNLTIVYDGKTLYDADVDEIVWTDSPYGVSVQGKIKPAKGSGKGLLDLITETQRTRTGERRAELAANTEAEPQP
jgi:hypothetical protein